MIVVHTRGPYHGCDGNVGREVAAALVRAGLPATAGVRNPERAPGLPAGLPTARLDFHDRSTWQAALAVHDAVFLVRPPAIADVEKNLNPFVDEAYSTGVKHIVFLSVAGADRNGFVPHAKVESHLKAKGSSFTNLRPGFFAQNLQDAYLRDILEDDRIILPAGFAKVNWIDVRDVADVAALIFADPGRHLGKGYSLTGPKPVSWDQVTRVLSEVTGRKIEYEAVSIPRYMIHLMHRGLPTRAIIVQTILHTLLRYGQGAKFDPTLENLLGRPGRSVETYIRDNAGTWQVDAAS